MPLTAFTSTHTQFSTLVVLQYRRQHHRNLAEVDNASKFYSTNKKKLKSMQSYEALLMKWCERLIYLIHIWRSFSKCQLQIKMEKFQKFMKWFFFFNLKTRATSRFAYQQPKCQLIWSGKEIKHELRERVNILCAGPCQAMLHYCQRCIG